MKNILSSKAKEYIPCTRKEAVDRNNVVFKVLKMGEDEVTRVELPLIANSKILSYGTIGKLKEVYPKLRFIKYIYKDPVDNVLRGVNPPDMSPLVPNAHITILGNMIDIIRFSEDATSSQG